MKIQNEFKKTVKNVYIYSSLPYLYKKHPERVLIKRMKLAFCNTLADPGI